MSSRPRPRSSSCRRSTRTSVNASSRPPRSSSPTLVSPATLLGIDTEAELQKSPFRGALFEGMVAAEIVKAQVNAGRRREIYYFRDQQGLEVDLVVPGRAGGIRLIEAKASRTVRPEHAAPMHRLAKAMTERGGVRRRVEMCVVHLPTRAGSVSSAISPGVRAVPWPDFVRDELG